jgi:hypothetical protein
MKIEAIRAKAAELGVSKAEKMKMPALIRAIQEAEGNPPSFGNNDGKCPYTACCWWDDCIKEYKRNH